MGYLRQADEQRRELRVGADLPAMISVGTQLTIQGKLKDISLKSAFITMKSTVYLKLNDEVGFSIQCLPDQAAPVIQGLARISRIAIGEGMAIYFTDVDAASTRRLSNLLK
ncbi:MAG: PilZ domain-containing protein [Candidatus Omnitrophota bacterium]